MIKKFILVVALVFAGLFVATKVFASQSHENGKVTICHYTRSHYVINTPNKSGNVDGHNEHDKDIIPPFDYWVKIGNHWYLFDYDGKNWTKEGQAIWNNDCEKPVSPTPTVEVTPTATPSATPTPTLEPECNEDCPTPTPTETPAPTPTDEVRGLTPAGAPICTDGGKPEFAPTVTKAWRDGKGNVDVTWTHTDPVNQYIVYYGLTGQDFLWNTGRVDGWETNLHFTPASEVLDVKVCAVSQCGAENCSPRFIDP